MVVREDRDREMGHDGGGDGGGGGSGSGLWRCSVVAVMLVSAVGVEVVPKGVRVLILWGWFFFWIMGRFLFYFLGFLPHVFHVIDSL